MKHIIFTGGGTAGHVTPNLALIEALRNEDWQIDYIGSYASVEQGMISDIHLPFHPIYSGKLRRYFSWKNFLDPFKILLGIGQSYRLLRKLKTDIVFSKGGFVAFPVVFAAWLNKIPVVAHESDMSPGLANRLSFPFVNKICVNFEPAKAHFKKKERIEITGTPIRKELFQGNKERGLAICRFNADKPCLLVMGGSLGAVKLNRIIRASLPALNQTYQVIHLCGKGNIDTELNHTKEYCQFDYASDTLADLFAASDLIVSRAGANALSEILALQKPHVLIPLSAKVSRGDQIQNAHFFKKLGTSVVVNDDTLDEGKLMDAINEVHTHYDEYVTKIRALNIQSATSKVLGIIKDAVSKE